MVQRPTRSGHRFVLVIEVARENSERKTPLLHNFVYFQMPNKTASGFEAFKYLSEKLPLFQKVTSEEAVSHNVLYYQQLSFACYRASRLLC